jgi:hypothetical protein
MGWQITLEFLIGFLSHHMYIIIYFRLIVVLVEFMFHFLWNLGNLSTIIQSSIPQSS